MTADERRSVVHESRALSAYLCEEIDGRRNGCNVVARKGAGFERRVVLMAEIVHTRRDTPAIVDSAKLLALACALRDLLLYLSQTSTQQGWTNE